MPLSPLTESDAAGHAAAARARFAEVIQPRLEILNCAGVALLEGRLKPGLCDAAQREARNLAGLLETMGFGAGARFVREMHEILNSGAARGSGAAMRYSELLVALGLDLETPRALPAIPPAGAREPLNLLVVSGDEDFSSLLEMEALARGWAVKLASDFAEGQAAAERLNPDVAILDAALPGGDANAALELLSLLSNRTPPAPVLALAANDTLAFRVEVARRKAEGFMVKSSPSPQIMEAASRLAERRHAPEPRVLAAGCDGGFLGQLCPLLAARGMAVKSASDPLHFWDALCAFGADLLVVSDDLPGLSAAELCRVVRGDPRFGEIPIIAAASEVAIRDLIAAGADDVVARPAEAHDFLARILNRLSRVQKRRRLAESELLRGALSRSKPSHMMGDFLELSWKHGVPFCLAAIEVEGLEKEGHAPAPGEASALLELIGHSLHDAFRSGDVLVRWGGNVFVAGMYGFSRFDGLERLDGLIAQIQNRTFMPETNPGVKITLSSGVAQFPDDGETIEELFQAAAVALEQAKKSGGAKAVAAGGALAARLDIALVMRDEAQAYLLLHELESRGYRARWIKEGKTAKRLIAGADAQIRPRVVLMDVDLPGIDGLSLLGQFARAGVFERTRVIMLTDTSVSQRAQAVIELGAYDQVAKPFNPAIVVQHIRRAMEAS